MPESAEALDGVTRQRRYYSRTASAYEHLHHREEHEAAIALSVPFMKALGIRSVLDTGCGTGLGMLSLQAALPGVRVHGNDPSAELLEVARGHGIASSMLDCVGSQSLPYPSESFDAVIETGMLHHVPDPDNALSEMMRVARLGVFISDSNFFGLGSLPLRLAKVSLASLRLLETVQRFRRGGHLWEELEGDGVSWDYSVFSAANYLSAAGAEVHFIATHGSGNESLRRAFPLLFATHGLVIALKRGVQP